ncbi:MAG: META domain-containing protein [Thiotrichales bacterium]|nr:MAG: META domain-containing protein [Thiotrichales bacterium]
MKKTISILSFIFFVAGCAYTGQSDDKPLLDTRWNLSEMFHQQMKYTGTKIPHLQFEAERVTGNDGCNNFFGPYKLEGDRLSFGLLASTRMACPDIQGFEIIFNKMLITVTQFRITGDRLDLYAGDELLASFIAGEKS